MTRPNRRTPTGKPITQHQLFPAIVALWFSTLFGLGSLAVRPSLLEGLVAGSRFDALVPAAAPPLGMTARILLALAMAILGAMLGSVIARLAGRPRPDPDTARDDREQRQPPLARRRALALGPDDTDVTFCDPAPVPGGSPQVFDIARAGLDKAPAAEPASGSLERNDAAPIVPPEDDRQVFGAAAPSSPPPEAPRQTVDAQPAEPPAAPGLDELAARLAESIRRRRAARAAASPAQAAPPAAAARRTFMATWPAAASNPESEDEPDLLEEAAVAEDSHASLLGLAPAAEGPRHPVARIEEAHPANVPIEPVVIFPGQATPPSAPPAADRPGAVSPDEAERALRAALAGLQRMNGAA